MKKIIFSLVIILNSFITCSQVNIVDEVISYLGNTPPVNFTQIYWKLYVNENFHGSELNLWIDNQHSNIVERCTIGKYFDKIDEANKWVKQFYNIAENFNWIFIETFNNDDIYKRNEIYLLIRQPYRTINGNISADIFLTKDLTWFFDGVR